MVAGDIVPFNSVGVDIVKNAHTGFYTAVDVELGVVGLADVAAFELRLVTGERPGLIGPAGRSRVGGRHLNSGSGPEPTVDNRRLEVLAVASLEVAETTARPDVGEIVYKGKWDVKSKSQRALIFIVCFIYSFITFFFRNNTSNNQGLYAKTAFSVPVNAFTGN